MINLNIICSLTTLTITLKGKKMEKNKEYSYLVVFISVIWNTLKQLPNWFFNTIIEKPIMSKKRLSKPLIYFLLTLYGIFLWFYFFVVLGYASDGLRGILLLILLINCPFLGYHLSSFTTKPSPLDKVTKKQLISFKKRLYIASKYMLISGIATVALILVTTGL